jgi:hypothetical protein
MAQKKNDNDWKIIVEHTGTPEQQKKVIKEAYRYLRMRSLKREKVPECRNVVQN